MGYITANTTIFNTFCEEKIARQPKYTQFPLILFKNLSK